MCSEGSSDAVVIISMYVCGKGQISEETPVFNKANISYIYVWYIEGLLYCVKILSYKNNLYLATGDK